jgi:hypothetical protein
MTIGNQTSETVNRLKFNLYLCQIPETQFIYYCFLFSGS